MKRFTATLFFLCCTAALHAAAPGVTSRVEPDSIFIGDRFTYIIEVDKDLVQSVIFPEFAPDPSCGVELVESPPADTVVRDGRRLKLRKRYVMAAFEEGHFDLGRASVLYADKNVVDTLYGDTDNLLSVGTFVIDSTSQAPYDIKPQKTLRFRFGEISGYLLWSLAALLALAAAVYGLVKMLERRGRNIRSLFQPAPPVPAHVAAIKALEELHNRKLWQSGKCKAYYSALSDILRTYLSGRYGIGAMEMTTDEIAGAVKGSGMSAKSTADLLTVLRDSDLVKFAKFEPDEEQNEGDWQKAYWFVEETKPAEPQTDGAENQSNDTRP